MKESCADMFVKYKETAHSVGRPDDGSTRFPARLDALPGRGVANAVGGPLGQQIADPDVGVSRMIEGAPVRVESGLELAVAV
ncbi:hypothetical protein [Streptomyces sp. NPDC005784]|uniref:hypothetical protein n=1 Tax=Streptomyces sp. NPDC005784 TaxID=3364731 RepID=UPI0036C80A21